MSKYTTELRFLIESGFPLFDFNYPFYDESKRLEFQNRFIKHFYFHEIGQETAQQFKHFLEIKFNEILPYYNVMFETARINYDPLETYDITEEYTKANTGTNSLQTNGSYRGTDSGSENVSKENVTSSEMNAQSTETATDTTNRSGETTNKTKENVTDTTTGSNAQNKAFSDTPQGRVTISETSDYVSNLEHNLENKNEKLVHVADNETTGTTSGTDESTHAGESSQSGTTTATGTEQANTTRSNSTSGTTDSSTNEERTDNEVFKRRMYGDMGVRPASYLLEEHLKFQRTITTIENQFFEECNDLFMELW